MPVLKRIGILGGTFDPVHYGHLRTALEIKNALQLDEMRLMPCAEPVHRTAPMASPEQRLELLRLAITEFPDLRVDDCEVQRGGKSWMVETLSLLIQRNQLASFCLLLGVDAFMSFTAWREWQTILQKANLIVMRRPGYQIDTQSASGKLLQAQQVKNAEALKEKKVGGILVFDVKPYAISSSEIRDLLRDRESVENLLPETVLSTIKQKALYLP